MSHPSHCQKVPAASLQLVGLLDECLLSETSCHGGGGEQWIDSDFALSSYFERIVLSTTVGVLLRV